jgi:hypothetical protein
MLTSFKGDDYLPILRLLLNHSKIDINQQNEVFDSLCQKKLFHI